jgi:alkylation response protein AidB-like acyl-CoA dehydrogenase
MLTKVGSMPRQGESPMHWELSEEQELYTTSLRQWLQEHADSSSVRGWLDRGDLTHFEHIFVDEGWGGVGFDEAVGGQGGGMLELALTARELGRSAVPSAGWMQTAIVVPALSNETAALTAAVTAGEVTALAVRADRIPQRSSVQISGDRLTGEIPCVLGAPSARHLLVPVSEDDSTSLWLADRAAAGVGIHPRPLLDRSRDLANVTFDDAVARRLDVDATAALDEMATRAGILAAADALGAADRMLDLTIGYSKQRHQFGRPIGSFQAVKHAAAQMLVTVESSMSIAFYAAQSVEERLTDRALHAAVTKAQVTRHVAELADSALSLHGAIGYTWEHDLHLYYKRAKLDRVLFGSPAAWNERIAGTLPLLPVSA